MMEEVFVITFMTPGCSGQLSSISSSRPALPSWPLQTTSVRVQRSGRVADRTVEPIGMLAWLKEQHLELKNAGTQLYSLLGCSTQVSL